MFAVYFKKTSGSFFKQKGVGEAEEEVLELDGQDHSKEPVGVIQSLYYNSMNQVQEHLAPERALEQGCRQGGGG